MSSSVNKYSCVNSECETYHVWRDGKDCDLKQLWYFQAQDLESFYACKTCGEPLFIHIHKGVSKKFRLALIRLQKRAFKHNAMKRSKDAVQKALSR